MHGDNYHYFPVVLALETATAVVQLTTHCIAWPLSHTAFLFQVYMHSGQGLSVSVSVPALYCDPQQEQNSELYSSTTDIIIISKDTHSSGSPLFFTTSLPPLPSPSLPSPLLPSPPLSFPPLPSPSLPYPLLPSPTLSFPPLPSPLLPSPTLSFPPLPSPSLPYPLLPSPPLSSSILSLYTLSLHSFLLPTPPLSLSHLPPLPPSPLLHTSIQYCCMLEYRALAASTSRKRISFRHFVRVNFTLSSSQCILAPSSLRCRW